LPVKAHCTIYKKLERPQVQSEELHYKFQEVVGLAVTDIEYCD